MRNLRRGSAGRKKGVSEVVGNIMILGITVALFSTVFYWFYLLPTPEGTTYTDIQMGFASTGYNPATGRYNYTLTLKHQGGDAIRAWESSAYVMCAGNNQSGFPAQVAFSITLADGKPAITDRFSAGMTWAYSFASPTTPETSKATVYLLNKNKNAVFWERSRPVGESVGPYLINIGVLAQNGESQIYEDSPYVMNGQNFKVYAKYFDPRIRIASVYANMSSVGLGSEAMSNAVTTDSFETNPLTVDGFLAMTTRDITVTAYDSAGNALITQNLKLTIIAATVVSEYVDVGQMCDITWNGPANTSVGRELQFSNDKPMTGERILITATVRNIGNLAANNATITFYDGSAVIGTVKTSISALGRVDIPLSYAFSTPGSHRIFVNVTGIAPADQNPDITIGMMPGFRNLYVSREIKVYVYFDDLESGVDKWRHEATILRINGEAPLEYDEYSTNVDVSSAWDSRLSNMDPANWTVNSTDSHSSFNSYKMTEAKKAGPADVVLCFDTSDSMSGSFLQAEKDAAKSMLMFMTDDSRIAIVSYAGGGNVKWAPTNGVTGAREMWTLNTAGRASATSAINGLSAQAVTQVWDAIGNAFDTLNTIKMKNHIPAIVALTDGCDRLGSDSQLVDDPSNPLINDAERAKVETGSNNWAPWGTYAAGPQNYLTHFGKYGGSFLTTNTGYWYSKSFVGGGTMRKGLLSLPIRTFTIGLNLEHHEPNVYQPTILAQPTVLQNEPPYPVYAWWSGGVESGTVEYNLWRIADTSNGTYFYAPTGSQLAAIYEKIAELIIKGNTQKGSPSNEPGAAPGAPSMPAGPATGSQSTPYTFTTTATDPDAGNTIRYGWDWNDDDIVDEWSAFVVSGTPDNRQHAWANAGAYTLKVRAQDNTGSNSSWSPTASIYISGSGMAGKYYWGNKSLVSGEFNLGNRSLYETATLSFYHKYDLLSGFNGGAVFVGLNISGSWRWRYVVPQPTYTGNINVTSGYYDDNHLFPGQSQRQRVFFVYNGVSGLGGSMGWEYSQVDLTRFIPGNDLNTINSKVRVMFKYLYCSGGAEGSWWLDDVEVKVSRNNTAVPLPGSKDLWHMVSGTVSGGTAHSGTHSWFNRFQDPSGNKVSVDNSLITTMNLVNVKNATLVFYTRFNINSAAGLPPQGFRVEVSSDNGANWRQINLGVRTCNGTSGAGTGSGDRSDGVTDGKSYAGIVQAGDNPNWVPSTSLTRLNCDLTRWAGQVILLRFRVVINNLPNFPDYSASNGFPGLYIDDIVVIGNVSQQSSAPCPVQDALSQGGNAPVGLGTTAGAAAGADAQSGEIAYAVPAAVAPGRNEAPECAKGQAVALFFGRDS